ncbi:MAG: DUF4249 domain-containing protein [Bacteroidales bacterium]
MNRRNCILDIFSGHIFLGGMVTVLLIVMTIFGHSCIEPYMAAIDDEPELITIEGSIIKGNQLQWVVVSKTSSLNNPDFIPVRGCQVSIIDELSNEFVFEEYMKGAYILEIEDDQLVVGRRYKLAVSTPEGDEYESAYEALQNGVAIDSIYYNIEERVQSYSGNELEGIRFFVDINAPDTISRYFRWKITETYEYTSYGPISYFYYDTSLEPVPPDDIWGVYRCWMTEDLQDLYLTSTTNLTVNEKKKVPLNYVSTETDRLKIKYSLLVNQYSLEENAYNYFMQNKIATDGSGGLYTSQPQQPLTNLYNVNDPSERVLGYFWLSSVTKWRIMVPRINSLQVNDHFYPIETFNMEDHADGPFPLYIMEEPATGVRLTGSPYCFDCTRRGGTTTRPSYWD